MDAALLDQLHRLVGPRHVVAGEVDAEVYSYDGSLASGRPEAVVFPADTAQTAAVVRMLAEAGVPFVPRGFGTNLSGGSVTSAGGVVLSLARLTVREDKSDLGLDVAALDAIGDRLKQVSRGFVAPGGEPAQSVACHLPQLAP